MYRRKQRLAIVNIAINEQSFFWDITPCRALKVYGRFRGKVHLHADFLIGSIFVPKEWG
jgi:hypothetical protein